MTSAAIHPAAVPAQAQPMRAYTVCIHGLQYVAMAPSACQAVIDAQALHGLATVVVKPLRLGGKGAA